MSKNDESTSSKKTEQSESGEVTKAVIYTFMLLMIFTGAINTISNKLMQSMESLGKMYSHPWFITFNLFISEFSMQIPYWIMEYQKKQKSKKESVFLREYEKPITTSEFTKKKPEIPILYMAIPAMFDVFASTIMTVGVSMMAGSVFQMLRGAVILFTALASVLFLKRNLYRHHFCGMGIVISGLVLVGLGALVELNGKGAQTEMLGVILIVAGQVFTAGVFVSEEKLMSVYNCHPVKLVAFEGMWASLIYCILMIIFYYTPCPFENGSKYQAFICVNNGTEWKLEDIIFAFRQLGGNGWVLFNAILFTFSIAIFNYVGISVTKYVSASARSVLDTIRTVIVWLFFLLMPFVPDKSKEEFSYFQLAGFVFLIIGTCLYTEAVQIPWCGLDKFTQDNLKKLVEIAHQESETGGGSYDAIVVPILPTKSDTERDQFIEAKIEKI